MNRLSTATLPFVTLGLLLVAGANVATATPKKTASNPYECFTDDSDGRKRPCSAGYRQMRGSSSYDCSTDDGYGRKRPCAAELKRR